MSAPPMTPRDRRVLGCLLGCCGVLVVVFLAVGGFVYYYLNFGAMKPAPRADTLAQLPPAPALLLHLNAEAATAFSPALLEQPGMSAYNGAFLRLFRPYEGSLALAAVPDSDAVAVAAALSMPHGAGFVITQVNKVIPPLEQVGVHLNEARTLGDESGVALAQGTVRLPAEAPRLRAEGWPEPMPGDAPALERNHFIELLVDNRNGDAALCMAALAQLMGEQDELSGGLSNSPRGIVPLSLLSQVRLIKGMKFVKTAQASCDFLPMGDVNVKFRVEGRDEVSALMLMTGLGDLPHSLGSIFEPEGVHVEAKVERQESVINGDLHFRGVIETARKKMDAYNNQSRSQETPWFLPPAK